MAANHVVFSMRCLFLLLLGLAFIGGMFAQAQDDDFDLPPIDEAEQQSLAPGDIQFPPGSRKFKGFPTAETDTRYCLANTKDRDDCYAAVAAKWVRSDPCDQASDRNACLDRAAAIVVPECTKEAAQNLGDCYLIVAGQLGSESTCEKVSPTNRSLCYATAAATRKDLSMIDRHISDPEEKATYQAVYARETLDLDVIDQIDFSQGRYPNTAYNGTLTSMILPLALEKGERLPDNFCDRLRGNYVGDYPEDEDIDHDLCGKFLKLSHDFLDHMGAMETDEERAAFRQAWLEQYAEQVARAEDEQEIADQKWRKEEQQRNCVRATGKECPDAKMIDVPEGALTFYTGQTNELTFDVWNGTNKTVKEILIAIEGQEGFEESSQWIELAGMSPSNLEVEPLTSEELTLTFSIPADAPDNQLVSLGVVGGSGEGPADRFLIANVDILIKRRAVLVSTEFEGGRGAPSD